MMKRVLFLVVLFNLNSVIFFSKQFYQAFKQ